MVLGCGVVLMQELVLSNRLSATSKFWRVAFEGVLLQVVDAEQSRKDARVSCIGACEQPVVESGGHCINYGRKAEQG
jgi:hypothetical protein